MAQWHFRESRDIESSADVSSSSQGWRAEGMTDACGRKLEDMEKVFTPSAPAEGPPTIDSWLPTQEKQNQPGLMFAQVGENL